MKDKRHIIKSVLSDALSECAMLLFFAAIATVISICCDFYKYGTVDTKDIIRDAIIMVCCIIIAEIIAVTCFAYNLRYERLENKGEK